MKAGIRGSRSARRRTMRMSDNSGRGSRARWRRIAERSSSAFCACREPFHQRDVAAVAHQAPARRGIERGDVDAGFLQKFAAEAAGKIERAAGADVLGVRRPAGKIELPGCRRGGRHLADEIGAVGGPQRRRGKDIEDAGVRKVPIAPSEKVRVIRLEAGAAQHAVPDRVAMNEQHAAVP